MWPTLSPTQGANDITFPWSRGVIADVAGDTNGPT